MTISKNKSQVYILIGDESISVSVIQKGQLSAFEDGFAHMKILSVIP